MKNLKIESKICELEVELEVMETKIRTIISDPLNTNYPKVGRLCQKINTVLNQIEVLKEITPQPE